MGSHKLQSLIKTEKWGPDSRAPRMLGKSGSLKETFRARLRAGKGVRGPDLVREESGNQGLGRWKFERGRWRRGGDRAESSPRSPPFGALREGENQGGREPWRDLPFLGLRRYPLGRTPAGRFLPQETAGVGHTQPAGRSAHARPRLPGPRGRQRTARGRGPRAGGVATRARPEGGGRTAPPISACPSGAPGRWLRMRTAPLRGPRWGGHRPPQSRPPHDALLSGSSRGPRPGSRAFQTFPSQRCVLLPERQSTTPKPVLPTQTPC